MRRVLLLFAGLLVLAGVAVASSGGATQAQPHWVVTDLGTLGGKTGDATAINDKGEIVGSAQPLSGGQGHAFLRRNRRMVDLGTFGGKRSEATDINEQSQVVGWADTKARGADSNPIMHGFLWQKGKKKDLGSFSAEKINDRGQIVGFAEGRVGLEGGPVLWQAGRVTELPAVPGTGGCGIGDVNVKGQVVGICLSMGGEMHAVLWQGGGSRDLGDLGGITKTDFVIGINDGGQVVGARNGRAFVWEKGAFTYLPTLRGRQALAADINEHGQVVGWLLDPNSNASAVVWENGRIAQLPKLHATDVSYAAEINDRGEVVGYDLDAPGVTHAVLWTMKR